MHCQTGSLLVCESDHEAVITPCNPLEFVGFDAIVLGQKARNSKATQTALGLASPINCLQAEGNARFTIRIKSTVIPCLKQLTKTTERYAQNTIVAFQAKSDLRTRPFRPKPQTIIPSHTRPLVLESKSCRNSGCPQLVFYGFITLSFLTGQ